MPKPAGYCAFARSDDVVVRLSGYDGSTEEEVKRHVLAHARREGYKGGVDERMKELGWWVEPVYRAVQLDQKDAARYRWLRDQSQPGACAFYLSVGMALHGVRFEPGTVDSFIDAAMAGEKGQG